MILRGRAVAAAVVVMSAAILTACTTGTATTGSSSGDQSLTVSSTGPSSSAVSPSTSPATSTSPSPSPSSSSAAPVKTVHVTSVLYDDEQVGVGMPIIMYMKPAPTDRSAFEKAVMVTVNGQPANGAWFWEQPDADEVQSGTIEAHYREQHLWPAHATIQVKLPIGGLSAGPGLSYSGALSSVTFTTGAAHISTVNGTTLQMTVTSDGKQVAPPGQTTMPVSLGAAGTPTYLGTKVVMQKGEDDPKTGKLRPNGTVLMVGTSPSDPYHLLVQWSVRVTQSGEYVHAAPWNEHLGQYSSSNGCTNLSVTDAKWFYNFSLLGDVVTYVDIPHNAGKMRYWDGYGDWNVPWAQWLQGKPAASNN